MQRKLILAEKPAVARDLARVLGIPLSGGGGGAFYGTDYVVTWCIGHLVELEEPGSYQAAWKRWSLGSLPMLPEGFLLRPVKSTQKQWRVVRELLGKKDFAVVINACDAGREGELIFRLCYELSRCKLPVERLWISSLTDQAIAQGLARLRRGQEFDLLADAARCRAEADWLVGMNATRAVTLQRRQSQDVLCSIGRVQTPTLGLLVAREKQIRSFVPRDYWEVHADLTPQGTGDGNGNGAEGGAGAQGGEPGFTAVWHIGLARRLGLASLAQEVVGRSTAAAAGGEGPVVETVEARTVHEAPPLLFDLTALQRTANRRHGLSAHRTLQVAQGLYEKHKLITYPRTDSRYLTTDLIPLLPKLFAAIGQEPAYAPFVATLLARPPAPPRRVFQDGRARDHHAIIPTQVALGAAKLAGLDREERLVLDLIVRRFLGAFFPDAEFHQTRVVVRVGALAPVPGAQEGAGGPGGPGRPTPPGREAILAVAPPPPDRYEARGRVRITAGWQDVAGYRQAPQRTERSGMAGERGEGGGDDDPVQVLPRLSVGQPLRGVFRAEPRQTQPPPRYSEASLLASMEAAGQHIEDEELRQQMKDVGLGTPATRAAIIETLILRTYIERSGKLLHPTALGMDLVEHLPVPSLASPELTGRWEGRLSRMARGEETRQAFMADIARYVSEIVEAVRRAPVPAAVPLGATPARAGGARGLRGAPPAGTRKTGAARRKPDTEREPARAPRKARGEEARTGAVRSAKAPGRPASRPAAHPASRAAPSAASRAAAHPASRAAAHPASHPAPAAASHPASPAASRSALAAEVGAVGAALRPELVCPRCTEGHLIVGRRGWGCSRWQSGCPLVVPFEMLGRRIKESELRDLVAKGATGPMEFRPGGAAPVKARLRLAVQGSPAGFLFLEPLFGAAVRA